MSYQPPFTVSPEAISLVADISAKMEHFAIRLQHREGLRLRKVNRIKTIHSSLAIEGNTLSEDEVRMVMDGKRVIAPQREVEEVRCAMIAYDSLDDLNPLQERDLLRAHGMMMQTLMPNAGRYRSGDVGVYSEQGLVHAAPPARMVPQLMGQLFAWLGSTTHHALIASCVFHYEMEFIHPFADGNGRTGRLWQSLILKQLHPAFAHLPIENMVRERQADYYAAIAESTRRADSGPFIDFMLRQINNTIDQHQGEALPPQDKLQDNLQDNLQDKLQDKLQDNLQDKRPAGLSPKVFDQLIVMLRADPHITATTIANRLSVSTRTAHSYIALLRNSGIITREGSNKTGWWRVNAPTR